MEIQTLFIRERNILLIKEKGNLTRLDTKSQKQLTEIISNYIEKHLKQREQQITKNIFEFIQRIICSDKSDINSLINLYFQQPTSKTLLGFTRWSENRGVKIED